jgi:heme exporter protein C
MSQGSTMAATMLTAMLVMTLAFWMYTIAVVLTRVRCEILERERHNEWVAEVVAREAP